MRFTYLRAWIRAALLTLAAVTAAVLVNPVNPTPSVAVEEGTSQDATQDGTSGPKTLFGGTVHTRSGETYVEGYDRVTAAYGGSLDALRMFFPGLPGTWRSIHDKVGKQRLVVSFKASPAAVVAGRYDAFFRRWFSHAPTGYRTYWTYWHEPEDDRLNLRKYRHAWQRIDRLADRAHNRKLRSTLITMCWTLDPKSGRTWRRYYPGNRTINVLAFDCYNTGRRNGVYKDPELILRPVKRLAGRLGKPWGIAEFGSTVVKGDGGVDGRARWLRDYARYVTNKGGRFATYFDSYVGFDYRLLDDTSRLAWRTVIQNW